MAEREFRCTKTYFGHLTFYYEPHGFVVPIAAIIDREGIVICVGHVGLCLTWKKINEGVI